MTEFFAARRFFNRDGSRQLVLFNLKTGLRLEESEEKLNIYGVNLGDFLYCTPSGSYQKTTSPLGFQVNYEGNVAVIRRISAKLVPALGGATVFENATFGKAKGPDTLIVQDQREYTVDFKLREDPITLLNGWKINFDAINCIPSYVPSPVATPLQHPIHGNGFSKFADLNTRPEDPLGLLRKDHLFSPISPPPPKHLDLQPLPELSDFSNLSLRQHTLSPALSTSSQFLPPPPGTFQKPPTPVAKPRSNTPLKSSPMSPVPPGHVPSKFLFAGRRIHVNGNAKLVLVDPKTGRDNYVEEEKFLNLAGISLGDWLRAKLTPGLGLTSFTKASHTANLDAKVEGDVAFVANIRGLLIEDQGRQIFQSPLFSNALCRVKMQPGKYFARISLLPTPFYLADQSNLYFEVTNLRPMIKQLPKFPPGSNPNQKFKGAGFKPQDPPKPITGAGFAQDPKPEPAIVGSGFTAPQPVKLRAVVMSYLDKDGVRSHFLWILEKQAEGRLMDKMCQLDKGHFFEGTFKASTNGKWTCQKYEKPLESLIQGGLDTDGTIWFKVKVEKFKAVSGNMKYAEAQAKYIGKIVDTEEKLTESCNGKLVKIQRKGVAKNDYVWSVVEVM